jgi:hypothetical protein
MKRKELDDQERHNAMLDKLVEEARENSGPTTEYTGAEPAVSCVLCPVSCVLCPVSCVLCPVSCVLCPVSCVLCPVSCVLCDV